MGIRFSSNDLSAIEAALTVLLTPLESDAVGWPHRVAKAVRSAVGSEKASVFLPHDVPVTFQGYDSDFFRAYSSYYYRMDAGSEMVLKKQLPCYNFENLFGENVKPAFKTEIYNDLFAPNNIRDHLGMAFLPDGPTDALSIAMVNCQSEKANDPRFAERGLAIMRLLRPAFCAGVLTRRSFATFQKELNTLVDAIPTPARIVGRTGNVLYQNSAFGTLKATNEFASTIELAVSRVARAVVAATRNTTKSAESLLDARPCEYVGNRKNRLRIVGVRLNVPELFGKSATEGPLVLITVEGYRPTFDARTFRERYLFTQREVEIAAGLSRGLTNKALASQLGISEHTVRHHIENVFLKMNVSSKAEAAAVLSG
jgi:DNA-binding CsgD family transcriptional regulator